MIPSLYDDLIKAAVDRYQPCDDWRLFKAQLFCESALVPDAVSPAGARGIAQFMPGTWAEYAPLIGFSDANPFDVKPAIFVGAYYMARLSAQWRSPRPVADRYSLAAASYNAGLGHLVKAQVEAGGVLDYQSIVAQLHTQTGHNSKETIGYVRRIWKTWVALAL